MSGQIAQETSSSDEEDVIFYGPITAKEIELMWRRGIFPGKKRTRNQVEDVGECLEKLFATPKSNVFGTRSRKITDVPEEFLTPRRARENQSTPQGGPQCSNSMPPTPAPRKFVGTSVVDTDLNSSFASKLLVSDTTLQDVSALLHNPGNDALNNLFAGNTFSAVLNSSGSSAIIDATFEQKCFNSEEVKTISSRESSDNAKSDISLIAMSLMKDTENTTFSNTELFRAVSEYNADNSVNMDKTEEIIDAFIDNSLANKSQTEVPKNVESIVPTGERNIFYVAESLPKPEAGTNNSQDIQEVTISDACNESNDVSGEFSDGNKNFSTVVNYSMSERSLLSDVSQFISHETTNMILDITNEFMVEDMTFDNKGSMDIESSTQNLMDSHCIPEASFQESNVITCDKSLPELKTTIEKGNQYEEVVCGEIIENCYTDLAGNRNDYESCEIVLGTNSKIQKQICEKNEVLPINEIVLDRKNEIHPISGLVDDYKMTDITPECIEVKSSNYGNCPSFSLDTICNSAAQDDVLKNVDAHVSNNLDKADLGLVRSNESLAIETVKIVSITEDQSKSMDVEVITSDCNDDGSLKQDFTSNKIQEDAHNDQRIAENSTSATTCVQDLEHDSPVTNFSVAIEMNNALEKLDAAAEIKPTTVNQGDVNKNPMDLSPTIEKIKSLFTGKAYSKDIKSTPSTSNHTEVIIKPGNDNESSTPEISLNLVQGICVNQSDDNGPISLGGNPTDSKCTVESSEQSTKNESVHPGEAGCREITGSQSLHSKALEISPFNDDEEHSVYSIGDSEVGLSINNKVMENCSTFNSADVGLIPVTNEVSLKTPQQNSKIDESIPVNDGISFIGENLSVSPAIETNELFVKIGPVSGPSEVQNNLLYMQVEVTSNEHSHKEVEISENQGNEDNASVRSEIMDEHKTSQVKTEAHIEPNVISGKTTNYENSKEVMHMETDSPTDTKPSLSLGKRHSIKSTPNKNKENEDPASKKSRIPTSGCSRLPVLKPATFKVEKYVKDTVWASDFPKKKIPQPRKPEYMVSPNKLPSLLKNTPAAPKSRPHSSGHTFMTPSGAPKSASTAVNLPNSLPRPQSAPKLKSPTPFKILPSLRNGCEKQTVTPPKSNKFKTISSPIAEYIKGSPTLLIRNVTPKGKPANLHETKKEEAEKKQSPISSRIALTPKIYSCAEKQIMKSSPNRKQSPILGERQAAILVTPKPTILKHIGRINSAEKTGEVRPGILKSTRKSLSESSFQNIPPTYSSDLDISVVERQ